MIPQAFPVHTNRRPNPRIARLWSPAMGAVLLLTTAGCGDKAPKKEAEETPHLALPVKIVTVAPRDFERRFVVQGTLESKYYAHVAARVGGNLDAIWVDDGDRVEAGKTRLFQIDPVALSNAVSAAEQNLAVSRAGLAVSRASVEKTEAEFQKTERDYQRYRRLHEKAPSPTTNTKRTRPPARRVGRRSASSVRRWNSPQLRPPSARRRCASRTKRFRTH
jgi:multidrug efflux pump subunit AcrA (membrane-fusion protein)